MIIVATGVSSADTDRKPDNDTRPKTAEQTPASASATPTAPAAATAGGSLGERAVQAKATVGNAAIGPAGAPAAALPGQALPGQALPGQALPGQAPAGPSGPLGEVEIPLGNVNIYDRTEKPKVWSKDIAAATVMTIPIPELLVATVSIGARGRAFAYFNAWFGPVELQNLRLGMSREQAMIMAAGALSPVAAPVAGVLAAPISPMAGAALAIFGGPVARLAALHTVYKGPFKASAQLYAPVGGMVRFGVAAGLSVDAEIAKTYSVIALDAGVEGSVELDLGLVHPEGPPPTIEINYENGDLDFQKRLDLAANLKLELLLNAYLRTQLLGKWDWYKSWNVARTPLDKTWPLSPRLKIENKRGGDAGEVKPGGNPLANSIMARIGDTKVELTLGNDSDDPSEKDATDFLTQALESKKDKEEKKEELQPGGGASGQRRKHREPLGTRDDPILMSWYKPPHWYADPIYLDIGKGPQPFSRTERAILPHGEGIGVRRWPRVGEVFLITGIATPRSGSMQAAFRKALEKYGFKGRGWDADHVWDLALGGFDDYSNLWPLESGVNSSAGNWQLGQGVKYNKEEDPPDARRPAKAIKDNPDLASKYFKIRDFREPPSSPPSD
ncbi:hypothetical protein [Micromonospora sp. NPDC005305]|uniref:hypothetical protein n=1 Tax=Micromonospora sp. NPDC005305 TaxID=3156875 RepID=UPI0033B4554F